MTERGWFASKNAHEMLQKLGYRPSDRKGRLVSCSCVRLVWDSVVDERSRRAVEVAELFADSLATEYERKVAEDKAREVEKGDSSRQLPLRERFRAIAAKMCVIRRANAGGVCRFALGFGPERDRLYEEMAGLLRDIVGNPFSPAAFSPLWRTDTTIAIAQQMYDSRDFGAMPILADALQDAGCEDEAILGHCRDTTLTHVRGCWVVDLVLEKR